MASVSISNDLELENSDIIADFERTPTPETQSTSDIQKTVSMAHAAHNEAMKLLPSIMPVKRSRNARRRAAPQKASDPEKRTELAKTAILEAATPTEVSLAKSVLTSVSKPAELTDAEKVIMAVTESHRRNKARVLRERTDKTDVNSTQELGHSALGQSLKILKTSASTVISASAALSAHAASSSFDPELIATANDALVAKVRRSASVASAFIKSKEIWKDSTAGASTESKSKNKGTDAETESKSKNKATDAEIKVLERAHTRRRILPKTPSKSMTSGFAITGINQIKNVRVPPRKMGAWLMGLHGMTARQGLIATADIKIWTSVYEEKAAASHDLLGYNNNRDSAHLAEYLLAAGAVNEPWCTFRGLNYSARTDMKKVKESAEAIAQLKTLANIYGHEGALRAWNIVSEAPPSYAHRISFLSHLNIRNRIFECSLLLNHHCRPNCVLICTANSAHLVTCRDIKEGEELTISYIPDSQSLDLDSRTTDLATYHYLICSCDKCESDRKTGIPADDYRFGYHAAIIPISCLVLRPHELSVRLFCMLFNQLMNITFSRSTNTVYRGIPGLIMQMNMSARNVACWLHTWLPVFLHEIANRRDGAALLRTREFCMYLRLSMNEFDPAISAPNSTPIKMSLNEYVKPIGLVVTSTLIRATEPRTLTKSDIVNEDYSAQEFAAMVQRGDE
jgi:hypothetical protein